MAAGRALTQEQAITLLTSPTLSVLAITHGRNPVVPAQVRIGLAGYGPLVTVGHGEV